MADYRQDLQFGVFITPEAASAEGVVELARLTDVVEDGIDRVEEAMDLLTDALLSHFSYEERELVEPLARHGFY